MCETTWKKSIKKHYYIESFAKYGNRFFLKLLSYKTLKNILTTVDMETGEWGKVIKVSGDFDNIIIYNDCFYCITDTNEIKVFDLSGNKTSIGDVCPKKWGFSAYVNCIVDDKIYYCAYNSKKNFTQLMRCGLKGKKKEILFKFTGEMGTLHPETLRIDGDYIYAIAHAADPVSGLIRIPLYGGKTEVIATTIFSWFKLSEDSIFIFASYIPGDSDAYVIYKVSKDLTGGGEFVTKAYHSQYSLTAVEAYPFHYADGHLMVQGYNEEEYNKICKLSNRYFDWKYDLWRDIHMNYRPDYYWVSEDGEVEETIKGSGIKKKWNIIGL